MGTTTCLCLAAAYSLQILREPNSYHICSCCASVVCSGSLHILGGNMSGEVVTQLGETSRGVVHGVSESTMDFYASVVGWGNGIDPREVYYHRFRLFEEGMVSSRVRRSALQLACPRFEQIQRIAR